MSQPQPKSGFWRGDTHIRRSVAATGRDGLYSTGNGSSGVRNANSTANATTMTAQAA